MIKIFRTEGSKIGELYEIEPGSWIQLTAPEPTEPEARCSCCGTGTLEPARSKWFTVQLQEFRPKAQDVWQAVHMHSVPLFI